MMINKIKPAVDYNYCLKIKENLVKNMINLNTLFYPRYYKWANSYWQTNNYIIIELNNKGTNQLIVKIKDDFIDLKSIKGTNWQINVCIFGKRGLYLIPYVAKLWEFNFAVPYHTSCNT